MDPDTITVDEAVRKGNTARRLLNDPVMVEAFAAADASFVKEWREATNPSDREKAHDKQAALVEVKRALERILSDGEMAKSEAEALGREDLLLE